MLNGVAERVSREKAPEDPAAIAAAANVRETAAGKAAEEAAHLVFNVGGPCTGTTETAGTRSATAQERTAARVLARALDTAGSRERVAVRSTSEVPPGRVRMRGVRTAEAQLAAGAIVTAEQFIRISRTPVAVPPLRVGIACDVSGSMRWASEPVASAAWILANAARHTTVPTETATVIFGHQVRALTRPGRPPAQVTEFVANDNWEDIPTALDALDGALGLSRPGAARLVVIISDGKFRQEPLREGQKKLDRLRASGCAVLWLAAHDSNIPLAGATFHVLADPATTARAIGQAATAALRRAR